MVILAVGITAILQTFQTALVALANTRDIVRADIIIRNKMSEIYTKVMEDREINPMSLKESFSGRDDFEGRVDVVLISDDKNTNVPGDALYEVSVAVARKVSGKNYSAVTYIKGRKSTDSR